MQDHTTAAPQGETPLTEDKKCCTHPNCTRAGQLLPLSEFYKAASGKPASYCKACIKRLAAERYNKPKQVVITKICHSKTCRRSGQLLPVSEFNKQTASLDGYAPVCRECANKRLNKQRSSDPNNKEKTNAYASYFRKTTKGRINDRQGKKKYRQSEKGRLNDARRRQRDKHKMKARYALNRAVDIGKLPPATECQCFVCGNPAKEYHHYLGYEPEHHLDVKPVCKMCHASIHHSQTSDTRS